ncbi:hypothetical protein D3C81_1324850 [compost metagenome]
MPPASDDCMVTCMPPRSLPDGSVSAPAGACTGTETVGAICASIACCAVTGTAGTICCESLRRSAAAWAGFVPPFSVAATSHITVPLRL